MMKRVFATAILLPVLWAALAAVAHATTPGRYFISELDATFELVPDANGEMRDVAVQLSITYQMAGTAKNGGHQYVGERPIRDLRVTDGEGRQLPSKKRKDHQYRISWDFPTISEGKQEVVAQFVIVGVRDDSGGDCTLTFDWLRKWPATVLDATFRFVLPRDDGLRVASVEPLGGQSAEYHGRNAFEVWRAELTDHPFIVRLETAKRGVAATVASWAGIVLEKTLITVVAPALLVLVIVTVLLVSRALSRKRSGANPAAGGGRHWHRGDDRWRGD